MEFSENDKKQLERLYSYVFGNGQTGADEAMRNMEAWMNDHVKLHAKQAEEHRQNRRDKKQIMIGLYLAVFSTLITAIVTILLNFVVK